jgi:hypothetical protein
MLCTSAGVNVGAPAKVSVAPRLYHTAPACLDADVLSLTLPVLTTMVMVAGPIEIRAMGDCPSTADVLSQLRPLMPGLGTATGEGDVATIEILGTGENGTTAVHLRVVREGAVVLGDRRLFLRESCSSMAETLATVIAAWETAQPLEADAVQQSSAATTDTVAQAATKTPGWRARVGLGLGAVWVGGAATAGVLETQLGPALSRWQLRLGFAAEQSRARDLAPGHVDWQHTGASASVVLRSLSPAWPIAVDVGVCAGWATLQGQGYPEGNLRQRSFEYGLVGAARAGRTLGRWTLWAEVRTHVWMRNQRALLAGAPGQVELPAFDLATTAGASVALFD